MKLSETIAAHELENVYRYDSYRGDRLQNHNSISFSDLHSVSRDTQVTDDMIWIPDCTSDSDYSGSLVEKSNYDCIVEDYGKQEWLFEIYGGHSYFGIGVWITEYQKAYDNDDNVVEDFYDLMRSLQDYPLISEDAHSHLEIEAQIEAWGNWAASDFKSELANRFDYDFDEIDDKELITIFEEAREKANEYWVNECGSDMTIDLENIVKHVIERPEWKIARLEGQVEELQDEIVNLRQKRPLPPDPDFRITQNELDMVKLVKEITHAP